MIRIKDFDKVSLQKKDNGYYYIHWSKSKTTSCRKWLKPLHINEEGHTNLSSTILVEWNK